MTVAHPPPSIKTGSAFPLATYAAVAEDAHHALMTVAQPLVETGSAFPLATYVAAAEDAKKQLCSQEKESWWWERKEKKRT